MYGSMIFGGSSGGRMIRLLTVIDEYTRRCLAIRVAYNLKSEDAMDVLRDLFFREGGIRLISVRTTAASSVRRNWV